MSAVEIAAAQHLQAAAETVGVALVDVVVISDAGVQSMVRAGHLFSVEPRYGVRGAETPG